jgi:hypothetical protein
MEDWEREYEEDRRRMASGGTVETKGRRGAGIDDDNPFQETRKAPAPAPAATSSGSGYGSTSVPSSVPASAAPSKEKQANNEESIAAYYAQYEAPSGLRGDNFSGGGGGGGSSDPSLDPRFGIPRISLPQSLKPLFGEKFGDDLYFAETCIASFKGFFSPNEFPMTVFVTPHCVYLGDHQTGELVTSQRIAKLRELQLFGDTGVGIRSVQGLDLFVRMEAQRSVLANVLSKIAAASGQAFQVRTLSSDAEKSYRKDIRYVDRKDSAWDPEEDPRSGVLLVHVPEQHQVPYAPIVPKILHWFGGVNHLFKDWKGAVVPERRGCWLTATSLFLSKPGGPQSDGRDITRCVGIEYMSELFDGPEGQLGIVAKEGPPQPHLALSFDDVELKQKMIFAIQKCYAYRKKAEIKKTRSENLERSLKIEKEKDFKPQLFQMKTRQDLFGLLRGKTAK